MFPVERVIPLGALQRALGHTDRNITRVAVAGLVSSSIVVGCEKDEVEVHRLFHEVLAARRHEAVEEAAAGAAREHEQRVASATAYFEAYHLVRTDGGWDALGRATEGCEELRDDECIVMTAVRQNGACFNFASERLKGEDRQPCRLLGSSSLVTRCSRRGRNSWLCCKRRERKERSSSRPPGTLTSLIDLASH